MYMGIGLNKWHSLFSIHLFGFFFLQGIIILENMWSSKTNKQAEYSRQVSGVHAVSWLEGIANCIEPECPGEQIQRRRWANDH